MTTVYYLLTFTVGYGGDPRLFETKNAAVAAAVALAAPYGATVHKQEWGTVDIFFDVSDTLGPHAKITPITLERRLP